jgi:hypothetical protein
MLDKRREKLKRDKHENAHASILMAIRTENSQYRKNLQEIVNLEKGVLYK